MGTSPPFGHVESTMANFDLFSHKEEKKFLDIAPESSLFLHTKNFDTYREDDYIDYRIVSFLKENPQSDWWYDWDAVLDGSFELPYGHVRFNDHAWEQGLKKYFPVRSSVAMYEDVLDKCFIWVDKHFGPFMMNSRVLDLESVLGEANRDASCGFPLRRYWSFKGEAMDDTRFITFINQYWDRISLPFSEAVVYTASLKGEFRPREKIKMDKTRVFSAGPIEDSIVGARLFTDQRDKLQSSLFSTQSAIGVRQTNLDFHRLYMRLREFDECAMLDANNWDGSILAELMIRVAVLRFKWLSRSYRTTENWWRIMNVYRNAIFNYLMFPNGLIYQTDGGMPSGFCLTADDNTLIHFAVRSFVAIQSGLEYDDMMDNSCAFLYGDDVTFSFDKRVGHLVGPERCIREARKIDIVYEPSDCDWDSLVFLQHTFVKVIYNYQEFYVGVRDAIPILCGWLQGGDHSWERAVERSSSYRIQAFFHPILFNLITEFMLSTLNDNDRKNLKKLRGCLVSQSELEELYFCADSVWYLERGPDNDINAFKKHVCTKTSTTEASPAAKGCKNVK